MAYPNGYPMSYPYYPQYQQPRMNQPNQTQYPLVQSGFVRVMNENEARMYPVAPGSSVTFIDESAPYCYTKTVDMSQLDRPKFERYRLVKEDDAPQPIEAPQNPAKETVEDLSKYALATDLGAIAAEINAIKSDIETMRGDLYGLAGKKKGSSKKEVSEDE